MIVRPAILAAALLPISKLPNHAVIGNAVAVPTDDPKTRLATIRTEHARAPGYIVLSELSRGH